MSNTYLDIRVAFALAKITSIVFPEDDSFIVPMTPPPSNSVCETQPMHVAANCRCQCSSPMSRIWLSRGYQVPKRTRQMQHTRRKTKCPACVHSASKVTKSGNARISSIENLLFASLTN